MYTSAAFTYPTGLNPRDTAASSGILGMLEADGLNRVTCHRNPPRNKGLIAGLIKGNQWLISPDHKAGYFLGEGTWPGGRGWLTSHDW